MRIINFKIAFVSIYLFIFTSCSSQRLVYEPLGEMDKPLPTIEITTSQNQKSDIDKTFILDKSTFESLIRYTQEQLKGESNVIKTDYEYGCYKITYYEGSKKFDYVLDTKSKSLLFFNQQLQLIKSYEQLYNEIEVLVKRLK